MQYQKYRNIATIQPLILISNVIVERPTIYSGILHERWVIIFSRQKCRTPVGQIALTPPKTVLSERYSDLGDMTISYMKELS